MLSKEVTESQLKEFKKSCENAVLLDKMDNVLREISALSSNNIDDEKISRDEIANTIAKETHFKVKDSEKKPWSLFGWLFGKS